MGRWVNELVSGSLSCNCNTLRSFSNDWNDKGIVCAFAFMIKHKQKNNIEGKCLIDIYSRSNAITTPASDAIALEIPMNSVAEIFDLAGGSCGTIISAPGFTRG